MQEDLIKAIVAVPLKGIFLRFAIGILDYRRRSLLRACVCSLFTVLFYCVFVVAAVYLRGGSLDELVSQPPDWQLAVLVILSLFTSLFVEFLLVQLVFDESPSSAARGVALEHILLFVLAAIVYAFISLLSAVF